MTLHKDQTEAITEPTRDFETGEWFTPLSDLVKYPKEEGEDGSSWHYPFKIKALGDFDIDISHSDEFYKRLKEKPILPKSKVLLVLPNRTELITDDNIDDWQKELETSILNFEGLSLLGGPMNSWHFPDWAEHTVKSPAFLEVDLPSGVVLRAPFLDFNKRPSPFFPGSHNPSIGALSFIWQGGLDNSGMMFPDGKHIKQNTHFRIVTE